MLCRLDCQCRFFFSLSPWVVCSSPIPSKFAFPQLDFAYVRVLACYALVRTKKRKENWYQFFFALHSIFEMCVESEYIHVLRFQSTRAVTVRTVFSSWKRFPSSWFRKGFSHLSQGVFSLTQIGIFIQKPGFTKPRLQPSSSSSHHTH